MRRKKSTTSSLVVHIIFDPKTKTIKGTAETLRRTTKYTIARMLDKSLHGFTAVVCSAVQGGMGVYGSYSVKDNLTFEYTIACWHHG